MRIKKCQVRAEEHYSYYTVTELLSNTETTTSRLDKSSDFSPGYFHSV